MDLKSDCVPDLKKERLLCSFVKEEVVDILDGSPENTAVRRSLEKYFLEDERFKDAVPPEYLSHADRYSNELRKAAAMVYSIQHDPEVQGIVGQMEGIRKLMGSELGMAITKDGNPIALHYVMFLPALAGQASPEQLGEWMGRAWSCEIIGTYAQTELGHGTYLRGLETTATYDPQTEEFDLHSPNVTSLKWWPGGLGKTANHAVVMCQLYTNGKCYGPHAFMVQLRDMDTHKSLKGITVGEIGPRLGMNTNDNGFLRLDHVRIPRKNMLMRHAQVSQSGEYTKPPSSKLNYGTMVFVRVAICFDSGRQLQRAVTIATRYSAVRRQGEIRPGCGEVQILDYQTQQHKLLPQIATVFAVTFSARAVWETYNDVTQHVTDGNLERLPELHALSCGLKAAISSDCTSGIEVCRLGCGGHGYLASSNLPRILTTTMAAMTYEGETTVMWLQLSRYLLKCYKDAAAGLRVPESVSFLRPQWKGVPTFTAKKVTFDDDLVEGWQHCSLFLLRCLASKLEDLEGAGLDSDTARNKEALLAQTLAQVFIKGHMCREFHRSVESLSVSPGTHRMLRQLSRLYLLYHTLDKSSTFLRSGYLSNEQLASLEGEYNKLLETLRPEAVNIVDSFDIDDKILDSTLGAWDGNVYERLYASALLSPLNKCDVTTAYEEHLQPLIKANL